MKLICIFTEREDLKKLSTELSAREGLYESSLQVCFQLYIIFTMEDRQPSQLQLITLAISVIMIIKTGLEAFFSDHRTKSYVHIARMFPVALFGSIFKIGAISILFSVLRFNAIYFLLLSIAIFHTARFIHKTRKQEDWMLGGKCLSHAVGLKKISRIPAILGEPQVESKAITSASQARNLFYVNIFWFFSYTIGLIVCIFLANLLQDTPMKAFYIYPPTDLSHEYKLSHIPLIKQTMLNINIFAPLFILSGIIFIFTIYSEFHEEFDEGNNNNILSNKHPR